jgi:uncharacterized membrane protein
LSVDVLQSIVVDVAACVGLFVGIVVLLDVGRRLGLHRANKDPDAAKLGTTAVDGAIFGLLGLLVAFTFSGAATRFDQRRQLIIDESNAIGTAYLRLDLLPPDAAAPLKEALRRYLDSRLATYRNFTDADDAQVEIAETDKIRDEIWNQTVAACKAQGNQAATMLLLPALNQMFDIMNTRMLMTEMHPPIVIFLMLGGLALVSALLAGFSMSGSRLRSWIHMLAFAIMLATTVYFVIDIEYPRRLAEAGFAPKGSEFLYAVGRIVVWVPAASQVALEQGLQALRPEVDADVFANLKRRGVEFPLVMCGGP